MERNGRWMGLNDDARGERDGHLRGSRDGARDQARRCDWGQAMLAVGGERPTGGGGEMARVSRAGRAGRERARWSLRDGRTDLQALLHNPAEHLHLYPSSAAAAGLAAAQSRDGLALSFRPPAAQAAAAAAARCGGGGARLLLHEARTGLDAGRTQGHTHTHVSGTAWTHPPHITPPLPQRCVLPALPPKGGGAVSVHPEGRAPAIEMASGNKPHPQTLGR